MAAPRPGQLDGALDRLIADQLPDVANDHVAAQIGQVAANALTALAAVGATPDHVVKSVIYAASDDRTVLALHLATLHRLCDRTRRSPRPARYACVACLGFDGHLVELDLIAALPD